MHEHMVVEIMGKRRFVGRVTEVTRYGGTFMQIEVYKPDGTLEEAGCYGGGAIFSFRPCSEELARLAALPRPWSPCEAFKSSAVLVSHCERCGRTEAEHVEVKQLPPAEDDDEGEILPGDAEPDSIPY